VTQGGTGNTNTSDIEQGLITAGTNLDAVVLQGGIDTTNEASVVQDGTNQNAELDQHGADGTSNVAFITQDGADNTAIVNQNGTGKHQRFYDHPAWFGRFEQHHGRPGRHEQHQLVVRDPDGWRPDVHCYAKLRPHRLQRTAPSGLSSPLARRNWEESPEFFMKLHILTLLGALAIAALGKAAADLE